MTISSIRYGQGFVDFVDRPVDPAVGVLIVKSAFSAWVG
jgi:hypothetical protein